MLSKTANVMDFWNKTWDVLRSEKLMLSLYGGKAADAAFESFSKPHRLVPFFQSKGFGAALYRLPDESSNYLTGKSFELARRKRRKAQRRGLTFRKFVASEHVDDMLTINHSSPNRQGRPVNREYLDPVAVADFCDQAGEIHGVFDADGVLKAYSHTPILGDIFLYSRLLGHADELEHGVMYFLITEVVADMLQLRRTLGHPHWAMYDMYWGAMPGLREFKRRLGFEPFRVTWMLGANHG